MTPTYSVKPGGRRYRYYASQSTFRGEGTTVSLPRIPAIPLEALVGDALTRLRLPPLAAGNAEAEGPTPVIRRIDIRASSVILQFDRQAALRVWRMAGSASLNDRDLISHHRGTLAVGEALADREEHLALTLPVRAHFRGGRAAMIAAPGSAPRPAGPDKSLIKAVARAHRWKAMLMAGEVTSIEALAANLKQERRHVGRTLSLAFLSPGITRAILKGEQPAGLRLAHLLDADIPLSWREQEALIERLTYAAR